MKEGIESLQKYSYAINTYEKILNKEIKSFSPYFFDTRYRKRRIIELTKYLIEEKLNMTSEEALEKLDYKPLKKYKLDCLLKYVPKPIETEKDDITHLIYFCYKHLPKPTQEELTISLYKKVLSGEYKNFPKNYFLDGVIGEERAGYCVKYLCFEVLNLTIEDIPKKLTVNVLREYKLKIILSVIYFSMYDLITSIFEDTYTHKDFK